MEFLLALLGIILGVAALVFAGRLQREIKQLSAGVESAIQSASRSRVASDAAAATLSRDQDELWRMRADVDSARREVQAVYPELEAVRKEIEPTRKSIEGEL